MRLRTRTRTRGSVSGALRYWLSRTSFCYLSFEKLSEGERRNSRVHSPRNPYHRRHSSVLTALKVDVQQANEKTGKSTVSQRARSEG